MNKSQCFLFRESGYLRSVILTERLILKSFAKDDTNSSILDSKNIAKLYSDPEVMRFVEAHRPYNDSEITELLNNWDNSWKNNNPASSFVAYLRPEDFQITDLGSEKKVLSTFNQSLFIGVFMLDPGPMPGFVELGYVLDKKRWGNGFALEGASALIKNVIPEINQKSLEFGFNFNFGLCSQVVPKIIGAFATTSLVNRRSIRILDQIGFEQFPLFRLNSFFNSSPISESREILDDSGRIRTIGMRMNQVKSFFIFNFS